MWWDGAPKATSNSYAALGDIPWEARHAAGLFAASRSRTVR